MHCARQLAGKLNQTQYFNHNEEMFILGAVRLHKLLDCVFSKIFEYREITY